VRLLDVAPTLAAVAGASPDPAWEGASLLGALTGGERLGERPAFAEAMSGGPLMAAAVAAGEKLIVFNRDEAFKPSDELQSYLWRHNLERLKAVEVYDLARDPGERHNLAGGPPLERLPLLAEVLARRLDRVLPGLRLTAAGIPAGSHLRMELTLARPAQRSVPYLLGDADRMSQEGARLVVELAGASPVARGVRVEGDDPGAATARAGEGGMQKGLAQAATPAGDGTVVMALSVTLDGRPLPDAQIRIGGGAPYAGGPLTRAALRTASFPAEPAGAASAAAPGGGAGSEKGAAVWVALWLHDGAGGFAPRAHDAEMERRLRALGYTE
jgi:hypothetical protein